MSLRSNVTYIFSSHLNRTHNNTLPSPRAKPVTVGDRKSSLILYNLMYHLQIITNLQSLVPKNIITHHLKFIRRSKYKWCQLLFCILQLRKKTAWTHPWQSVLLVLTWYVSCLYFFCFWFNTIVFAWCFAFWVFSWSFVSSWITMVILEANCIIRITLSWQLKLADVSINLIFSMSSGTVKDMVIFPKCFLWPLLA